MINKIQTMGYSISESFLIVNIGEKKINQLNIQFRDSNSLQIPYSSNPIYWNGERKPESVEQAEELVANGVSVKTSGIEMYTQYYDLNEEERLYLVSGYGRRTNSYFDAILKRIGLVRFSDATNSSGGTDGELDKIDTCGTYILEGDNVFEVGRISSGEYIAQKSIQYASDDYVVKKIVFNKRPSAEDIETFLLVDEIKSGFKKRQYQDVFDCVYCGSRIHWLDGDNYFKAKVNHLKESHCGCRVI